MTRSVAYRLFQSYPTQREMITKRLHKLHGLFLYAKRSVRMVAKIYIYNCTIINEKIKGDDFSGKPGVTEKHSTDLKRTLTSTSRTKRACRKRIIRTLVPRIIADWWQY